MNDRDKSGSEINRSPKCLANSSLPPHMKTKKLHVGLSLSLNYHPSPSCCSLAYRETLMMVSTFSLQVCARKLASSKRSGTEPHSPLLGRHRGAFINQSYVANSK